LNQSAIFFNRKQISRNITHPQQGCVVGGKIYDSGFPKFLTPIP